MIFEFLFILSLIFAILTFFYRQSVSDFRVNQIEWTGRQSSLKQLLTEKIPIVIREIPTSTIWTYQDILMRDVYTKDQHLNNLVSEIPLGKHTQGLWSPEKAEYIASNNGLSIWADKYLNNEIFANIFEQKAWVYPKYSCWYGSIPLRKTIATWNCILSFENEVIVSLLPQKLEYALPKDKESFFPHELNINNTPFYNDIKFLDIIVRPGNCLLIPSHWIYSISPNSNTTAHTSNNIFPLISIIEYHNPVSLFATYMKKRSKE